MTQKLQQQANELEKELAEARAEVETLKQSGGDIDTLVEQLSRAEARVAILTTRLKKTKKEICDTKKAEIEKAMENQKREIELLKRDLGDETEDTIEWLTEHYGEQVCKMVRHPSKKVFLADANDRTRFTIEEKKLQEEITSEEQKLQGLIKQHQQVIQESEVI